MLREYAVQKSSKYNKYKGRTSLSNEKKSLFCHFFASPASLKVLIVEKLLVRLGSNFNGVFLNTL